jgi:hypothetical protein
MGRTKSGEVPGLVGKGTVQDDVWTYRRPAVGPAFRIVARCAAAAIVLLVLAAAFAGVTAFAWSSAVTLTVALVVGVLGLAADKISGAPPLPASPTRRVLGLLTAVMRKGTGLPDTPVLRLRVVDIDGVGLTCELVGTPKPFPPKAGDVVEVFGRRDGGNSVRVREFVGADGTRLTGRLTRNCLVAVVVHGAAVSVLTLGAVAAAWAVLAHLR